MTHITALKIENWDKHLHCVNNCTWWLPVFLEGGIGLSQASGHTIEAKEDWEVILSLEGKAKTEKRRRAGDHEAVEKAGGAGKGSRKGEYQGKREGADPTHLLPAWSLCLGGWSGSAGSLHRHPSFDSDTLNLLSSPETCVYPPGSLTESPVSPAL